MAEHGVGVSRDLSESKNVPGESSKLMGDITRPPSPPEVPSVDVTHTGGSSSPPMEGSSPESAGDTPPPDGGWGWAVVAGSFLCHTLLEGFSRSLGVLFQATLRMFNGTNAETAVHQSLFNTLRMVLGIIHFIF